MKGDEGCRKGRGGRGRDWEKGTCPDLRDQSRPLAEDYTDWSHGTVGD